MPPDFEAKGFGFDSDSWQFFVRTRDGLTGFAETHLATYAIIGEHIRKIGDIAIDLDADSWPTPAYKQKSKGKASVGKQHKFRHGYTQAVAESGKSMTNSANKSFTFNLNRKRRP